MRSLLAALGLVFVAELGDKTQVVALGLGARHRLGPVVVGVAAGYAITNLLSVAVGAAVGDAFPARAVGLASGALFLGFAAWTLMSRDAADDPGDDGDAGSTPDRSFTAVAATSAVAIFTAELGDKTMLATATLASGGDPVLVWVGATIGIIAAGLAGVLVGRVIGTRLPERTTRLVSAALFAGFGAFMIITNL